MELENNPAVTATQQEPASTPLERTSHKSRNKKKRPKRMLLVSSLLLIGICTSLLGTFGYANYQKYNADYHVYMALAENGLQQLLAARTQLEGLQQNPFDIDGVKQANQAFAKAQKDFSQVDSGLQALPSFATSLPVYGIRVKAALDVMPITIEVSQAGQIACTMLSLLISRFHNPLGEQKQVLSTGDITTIGQELQLLKTTFYRVSDQINHLSSSELQFDSRLSTLVSSFHQYFPKIQAVLNTASDLLPILPPLLGVGKPTNYLIELLDSTELRPGGGFIGNYGTATFTNSYLSSVHITDIDLLDKPFEAAGHVIPYPSAYSWFDLAPMSWSLRDTNLDADFPTIARYSEQNYKREGGTVPVQGVIAITPVFIQQVLDITGAIYLPEYHETVSSSNLIALIHYHQLGAGVEGSELTQSPNGQTSLRKRFIELLTEHFMARVHQLPSSALPRFMQLILNALQSKDIQIYFNSRAAESYLQSLHLDASIQAPNSDSLLVVDANISPNKANQFITYALDDQITIDAHGNVTHHLVLDYTWKIAGLIYGNPLYRDYLRVYLPPLSQLQKQVGWQPRGTSKAFGRLAWAGFFTLTFGQTKTITLQWTEPHVVKEDTNGWHYQLLLQKQAGVSWNITIHLALPSCATNVHPSGGLISRNQQIASMTQNLKKDTIIGIDYEC